MAVNLNTAITAITAITATDVNPDDSLLTDQEDLEKTSSQNLYEHKVTITGAGDDSAGGGVARFMEHYLCQAQTDSSHQGRIG